MHKCSPAMCPETFRTRYDFSKEQDELQVQEKKVSVDKEITCMI